MMAAKRDGVAVLVELTERSELKALSAAGRGFPPQPIAPGDPDLCTLTTPCCRTQQTVTPATPSAPTTTTTVPPQVAPVPEPDTDALPSLEPGDSMVSEDGVATPVELFVENQTDLVLQGQDFVLRLTGECTTGCTVQTDPTGRHIIELEIDGAARVSGEGFLPGTPVYVWLFSEPRFLGEFTVQADGTFEGRIPLIDVEVGSHTLQVNGTSFDSVLRSANLGVIVAPLAVPTPGSGVLPATGTSSRQVTWALTLLATGAVLLAGRGRRKVDAIR